MPEGSRGVAVALVSFPVYYFYTRRNLSTSNTKLFLSDVLKPGLEENVAFTEIMYGLYIFADNRVHMVV